MMWTMHGRMVGGSNSIRMVRKAPFHGQFVPIWPVSAVFSARKANQTTGMGVVSVGKGLRDRQG